MKARIPITRDAVPSPFDELAGGVGAAALLSLKIGGGLTGGCEFDIIQP
jgi:hypothetical protein